MDGLLKDADRDLSRALERGALLAKPARHGVRVGVVPTTAFNSVELAALLAWRLGQYLLTGFYDEDRVRALGLRGEDPASVRPDDLHAVALDDRGRLICYATLKRPHGELVGDICDDDRPLFPCEVVHGRAWHRQLRMPRTPVAATWELARFCKDQRRGRLDAAAQRAPVELGLALGRLLRKRAVATDHALFIGDLDPEVALSNARFFFVPVATFVPHTVDLPRDDPLWPRYAKHATAPFLATPDDIEDATYIRWVDIDLALSCPDTVVAQRMRALRQIVSVRESSLKRPLARSTGDDYPAAAVASASSRDASAALWRAAEERAIPWRALDLGPGEPLPDAEVVWVLEGFAQAFTPSPGGRTHLASIGPEVAFVPRGGGADVIAGVEAATPLRALATTREQFEEFWLQRQRMFETSTATLYGAVGLGSG